MKEKIVLVGGGGHCKVVIDAIINAGEYEIEGIVDPRLSTEDEILGVPVLGNDDILPELYKKGVKNAFISVGSIGDCTMRKELFGKVKDIGFNFPVIIHPRAVIGRGVDIDEGTFAAASATVNPGTKIGKNVILNTSSSIDHDCEIGDFVHVAPGVTLCGGVKVGSETHIGAGANVVQYKSIGKRCFVKAGTVVSKDVSDGETWISTTRKFEDGESPE